jgi:nitrogen fixation NifU-like protein
VSDKHSLYQKIILDHNRNPRNFRAMDGCTCKAEGLNVLCGDQLTVFMRIEDGIVADVSFTGSGCAISKASASLMTVALKGKSAVDAKELSTRFEQIMTSDAPEEEAGLGELESLLSVREYPVRIKCATLPWRAVISAFGEGY